MNNRIIYSIVILITLYFLYILYNSFNSKYELINISADNYEKLLTPNHISVLKNTQIDNYIPDQIPLAKAFEISDSDNFRGNGFKVSNRQLANGNIIEITSYKSGIHYTLSFIGQSLNYAWIFKNWLSDESIPETPLIKKMILNLIINNGFTLKKSDSRFGRDIIIKETDDSFIIGDIIGDIDSKFSSPQSISFKSYRKTKYFNSLRLN
jgi:hypothetical protein